MRVKRLRNRLCVVFVLLAMLTTAASMLSAWSFCMPGDYCDWQEEPVPCSSWYWSCMNLCENNVDWTNSWCNDITEYSSGHCQCYPGEERGGSSIGR